MGNGQTNSRVTEIRRLNPALVEFDLDTAGLPKNSHWLCPIHRDVLEAPGVCEHDDCDQNTMPAMYKYYHRNRHMYSVSYTHLTLPTSDLV